MLRLPRNCMAANLEDLADQIADGGERTVLIPISLSLGGGLGSSIHAIQAIAELHRTSDNLVSARLAIDSQKSDDSLKRLASSIHGMGAIYFLDQVETNDQVPLGRNSSLPYLAERIRSMDTSNFRETSRGIGSSLVCFQGSRNEFLSPLYSNPQRGSVRPPTELKSVILAILSNISRRSLESISDNQLSIISDLLHELLSNADDHGSRSIASEQYRRSARGIHLQLTSLNRIEDIIDSAGADIALKTYLMGLVLHGKFKDSERPTVLELSVFDTGPGMGLKWLSEQQGAKEYTDFERGEELQAVLTCFKKHSTTKSSTIRGQGLTRAIESMRRLGAFMTLRTGRVSLYQDFNKPSTTEFNPTPRFAGRSLSKLSGTAFTIWFRVS